MRGGLPAWYVDHNRRLLQSAVLTFLGPGVRPHLPDLETSAGLYDILSLGSLLHMQHLVNRQYYLGELSEGDVREDSVARVAYLVLLQWLDRERILILSGRRIPLMALADRCFIFFAAGLVKMKEKLHTECPEVGGCDYPRFKREVDVHVKNDFPWLYARYCSLLKHDKFPLLWRDDEVSLKTAQIYRGISKADLGFLDHYMFDPYGYELPDDAEDTEEEESNENVEDGGDDEEYAEDEEMDVVGSKRPRIGT